MQLDLLLINYNSLADQTFGKNGIFQNDRLASMGIVNIRFLFQTEITFNSSSSLV